MQCLSNLSTDDEQDPDPGVSLVQEDEDGLEEQQGTLFPDPMGAKQSCTETSTMDLPGLWDSPKQADPVPTRKPRKRSRSKSCAVSLESGPPPPTEEEDPAPKKQRATQPTPVFSEPPKQREYDVIFIGIDVDLTEVVALQSTHLSWMQYSKVHCGMFVHCSWVKCFDTMKLMERLGFTNVRIWRSLRTRNFTSTVVLAGETGPEKMQIAHNHLPFELIGSTHETETMALDMAADMFALDAHLYVTRVREAQRVVRSSEYDTIVYDNGTSDVVRFLAHKSPSLRLARKRRLFAIWLILSNMDTLKQAIPDLQRMITKQEDNPNDMQERVMSWSRHFQFLPSPADVIVGGDLIDLAQEERWMRRAATRLAYFRRLARKAAVPSRKVKPPGSSPIKPRGFAKRVPISDDLAQFIQTHFPEQELPKDEAGKFLMARTLAVKLINSYIVSHQLQCPNDKTKYDFSQNQELQNLLHPPTPIIHFTTVSRLVNPHFPPKKQSTVKKADKCPHPDTDPIDDIEADDPSVSVQNSQEV